MAFFVTKSMTHIFDFPDRATLQSEEPCSLTKSDLPVIATAVDGFFSSNWESQLYNVLLLVIQRSALDESVPIGMVVLLDLLGDMFRMGTYFSGDECKLVLAPYPHRDYIYFAMGAFMLSYRLLSKDAPVSEGFWEQVMDGIVLPHKVHSLENRFRALLEENMMRYPPAPILPQDPAYKFYYAGDLSVPPNPLIDRKRYLRTKWALYEHVRTAMSSRGEQYLRAHPRCKYNVKDLLLQFPPCQHYIMKRDVLFEQTRIKVRKLWEASNREIHEYLEAEEKRNKLKELRLSVEKLHAMTGFGLKLSKPSATV
jgi:hypothetical protein